MAWRIPPTMISPVPKGQGPPGSNVAAAQRRMIDATWRALEAVVDDVRRGLLETVGIPTHFAKDDRTSILIELPEGTDTELIARAIALENLEAWRDPDGRVHAAIGPWYSTKDVDQVVLCVTKVVHVLLGLHAPKQEESGLFDRWLSRG